MIRRATPEDAPVCAAIVRAWIDGTDWMPDGPDLSELTRMIATGIPLREFWVAGEPVEGYLSLNPETLQIMGLYTARPGRGTGKALIKRAKAGRDYLQLRSHAPNTPAHRFYVREGFRTVEDNLTDGGDGIPEIRMEWRR